MDVQCVYVHSDTELGHSMCEVQFIHLELQAARNPRREECERLEGSININVFW